MALRFHQGGKLVVFGIGPASTDAVSIPISQLGQRLAELPDATEIVAYCRGPYCVFAHDAVRLLRAHGRATRRLAVGMPEWRLAGLPVAADAAVRPART